METLLDMVNQFFYIMIQLTVLFTMISLILGIVEEYMSKHFIRRVLSGKRGQGNFIGATLGSLTPFCSITTIPVLLSLLNSGASFGSTMSFFLASPLVNPVIIGLFWILFGWELTLMYSLFCFFMAVILGIVWEKLHLFKHVKLYKMNEMDVASSCVSRAAETKMHLKARIQRISYSAWSQFKGLFPYLLLGAGLGALIYGIVPEEWVVRVAGPSNPFAIPAAALIGTTLYVGVETMLPISVILLDMGMSIGAVMALIISAAAISIPEVIFLSSIFKRQLLVIYVLTILIISTGMGYISAIFFA